MSNIDDRTIDAAPPTEVGTVELRREIAQTRAEMSATIGAIEHRLSPKELKEQALVEFHEIEGRVKEVIDEKVKEVRTIIKTDLLEAKEVVSRELKHAVDGAKHAVRAATLGKVEDLATQAGDFMNQSRDTLIDTIKQNPIPAALTGLGLAWLLMNRSRSVSSGRSPGQAGNRAGYAGPRGPYGRRDGLDYGDDEWSRRTWPNDEERGISGAVHSAQRGVGRAFESAQRGVGHAVESAQRGVGGAVDQVGHAVGSAASQASHVASSTAGQISDAAGQVATQASHVASQAVDATGALVHRAGDAASHFAHDAGQFVSDAADGTRAQFENAERAFERTLRDNPVAVAGVAVALGALVGFSLPRTDREDAFLGPARDKVLEQAGAAAHDAAAAVHQATEKTVNLASKAVHEATKSASPAT